MKYELGDKVKISRYWKQQKQSDSLNKVGIADLEEYLASQEGAGDIIKFEKFAKHTIDEIGLIVGTRTIKTEYDLGLQVHDREGNDISEPYIYQESEHFESIYLVATRMNCLRRVSFEDIQYVGGEVNGQTY